MSSSQVGQAFQQPQNTGGMAPNQVFGGPQVERNGAHMARLGDWLSNRIQNVHGGAQAIQNQAVSARDNVLSKIGINPPGVGAPPPVTLPDQSVDVGFRGGAIAPFSVGPTTPETAISPPGSYNSEQAYRRGAQDYFRNDLAGDPQARSQAAFDELQRRNPDMAARFGRQNIGQYIPPFMGGNPRAGNKGGLLNLPAER